MSYIYNFCYLNLDKTKIKTRMGLFYSLIIVENILLVCLWSVSIKTFTDQYSQEEKLKIFSFVIGLLFMLLYYNYFHATKLGPIETHEISMKGRQTKLNFSNDICSSNGVGGPNTSTMSSEDTQNHQVHHHQQAVFNCVLPHQMQGNTKKKKMPSILPPPPAIAATSSENHSSSLGIKSKTPFWHE